MKPKEEGNAHGLNINGGKRVRVKKKGSPTLNTAHDKRHVTLSQVTHPPRTHFLYMEGK